MKGLVSWIVFSITSLVLSHDNTKRLLLNDPDVMERLDKLEKLVHQLQSSPSTKLHSGATYIRWGRSDCSHNNTRLIYSGYAGGSKYDASGAAVDNLCMPPDPDYEKTQGLNDYGRLYGAEYNSNFFASNADAQDVPCAVCEAIDSLSIIMIPGKMNCYGDWKMEYNGYLAAHSYSNPAATSYACIDKNPQFLPGGHVQYNEKVFGEVLTKCGSLPCPPYIEGYPVTCVVCSK